MRSKNIRINSIADIVQDNYDCIYDLCCDHGLIGKKLSQNQPDSYIYYVDVVPTIIDKLNKDSYITHKLRSCVLAKDARNSKFKIYKKNLFIISGIGAELGIEIYQNIQSQITPDHEVDFIFCIHQHIDKIHDFMATAPLRLKAFKLVKEREKYFEIFYLAIDEKYPKDPFLESLELFEDAEYLSSRIHYLEHKLSFVYCPKKASKVKIYQTYLNKLYS